MSVIGLGSMGYLTGYALYDDKVSRFIPKGNTDVMLRGVDSDGYTCGVDEEVKGLDYLYFPNPPGYDGRHEIATTHGQETSRAERICVEECPGFTSTGPNCTTVSNADGSLEWCQINTFNIFYYCIGDNSTKTNGNFVFEAMYDVWDAKIIILYAGFPLTLILSFIYLVFLRVPCTLRVIVWSALIGVLAVLSCGAYLTHEEYLSMVSGDDDGSATDGGVYEVPDDDSEEVEFTTDTQILAVRIMSYVLAGLAALWLCFLCCMCKRIETAITIVLEACKAFIAMPTMIFVPMIQTIAVVAVAVVFVVYSVHVYAGAYFPIASGDDDDGDDMDDVNAGDDDSTELYGGREKKYGIIELWFLLFAYFWTSEYIAALGQLTVAMAVGCWFFDRRLADERYAGCFTPFVCLFKVLRYHTGTAAFGSFLIAIVKLVRALLLKVQKSLKKKTKGSYCAAPMDIALCCCQCCLWCLEKCIRYISRQAYIQTALVGYNFCKAARVAVSRRGSKSLYRPCRTATSVPRQHARKLHRHIPTLPSSSS